MGGVVPSRIVLWKVDDENKVFTELELDEGRRKLPWSEVPRIRWPYQVASPEMWLDCLVGLGCAV